MKILKLRCPVIQFLILPSISRSARSLHMRDLVITVFWAILTTFNITFTLKETWKW